MAPWATIAIISATMCAPPEPPKGWSLADVLHAPWAMLDAMVESMEEGDWSPAGLAALEEFAANAAQPRYAAPYPSAGLEAVASAIGAEVHRPGRMLLIDAQTQANATEAHPLPLVGSWAKGHNITNQPVVGTVTGIPPHYQYQLLRQGRRLLPWFGAPAPNLYGRPGEDELWGVNGEQQFIQTCAALGLPISFTQGGQWEQLLDPDPRFSGPNHVPNDYVRPSPTPGGLAHLSPAGSSNAPWNAVGARAGSLTLNFDGAGAPSQLGTAAALYPNPPRVFFLSNDEMKRVRWADVPEYQGYSPETARAVWGTRFRTVYGTMFDAFRRRLPPTWAPTATFVSYKAFGFDGWSRFGAWWKSSAHSASFGPSPFPYCWDGAAVQTFPLPGDVARLLSPFADAMNFVFMADAALAAKPSYWQEMTVRNDDDSIPAVRWGAFCRHGIWLLRPRVVRVWESSTKVLVDDPAMQARFKWTLDEVDAVWNEPTLRRFWQWGRLLHNDDATGTKGPYQVDIPPAWETPRRPRWFRLTVDRYGDASAPGYPFSDQKTRDTQRPLVVSNPGRTSHYNQMVDVWSLALVNGPVGRREWLVYLFSSSDQLDFGNVILSLPDDQRPGRRLTFKSLFAHRYGKFFYFTEGADGQPTARGEVRPPAGQPLPPFARIVQP